jgi:hypothetical protein
MTFRFIALSLPFKFLPVHYSRDFFQLVLHDYNCLEFYCLIAFHNEDQATATGAWVAQLVQRLATWMTEWSEFEVQHNQQFFSSSFRQDGLWGPTSLLFLG